MFVQTSKVAAVPAAADGGGGLGLVLCEKRDGGAKVVRNSVSEGTKESAGEGGQGGHKAEGVQGASGTLGGATLPGHGRRMRVSTRPGEKRSDQSRVTICDLAATEDTSDAKGLNVLPREGGAARDEDMP